MYAARPCAGSRGSLVASTLQPGPVRIDARPARSPWPAPFRDGTALARRPGGWLLVPSIVLAAGAGRLRAGPGEGSGWLAGAAPRGVRLEMASVGRVSHHRADPADGGHRPRLRPPGRPAERSSRPGRRGSACCPRPRPAAHGPAAQVPAGPGGSGPRDHGGHQFGGAAAVDGDPAAADASTILYALVIWKFLGLYPLVRFRVRTDRRSCGACGWRWPRPPWLPRWRSSRRWACARSRDCSGSTTPQESPRGEPPPGCSRPGQLDAGAACGHGGPADLHAGDAGPMDPVRRHRPVLAAAAALFVGAGCPPGNSRASSAWW